MKFRFKYKRFNDFYRPVIPVQLRLDKKTLRYEALLDSGADICIFHAELGELLGLDFNRLKSASFKGLSSKSESLGFQAIIDVGISNNFHSAPLIFSYNISPYGYGILGQKGFFEFYRIKFDYCKKEVELKSIK